VVDANVEVFAMSGKSVHKETKATSISGAFAFSVKNLPSDFRIVVTGGTCQKKSIKSELSADFRDFDSKNMMAYVNPVTSVVSGILKKNTKMNLADAIRLTRKTLEMPEFADIGPGLQIEQDFFSPALFAGQMQQAGGLHNLLSTLVKEALSGKTHSFAAPKQIQADPTGNAKPATKGLRGSAGMYIAKGLGSGVLGYIGSAAFGKGLSAMDLGDNSIQEMQEMMTRISAQLAQLQVYLMAIQQQIRIVDYNTIAVSLNSLVSKITTTYESMRSLQSYDRNSDYYKTELKNIQSVIRNSIMPEENSISNLMLGVGLSNSEGMIQKWSKAISGRQYAGKPFFFSRDDSLKQNAMFDYWDNLQAMQLDLIISYLNSINASQKEINSHRDKFYENHRKQVALVPKELPEWVLVCQTTEAGNDIMIRANYLVNPYCWCNYDRACTVLKEVNANSNWGLGFNNWRFPNYKSGSSDIRAMFDENENGDYRNQALNRGWPSKWLEDNHTTFFVDNEWRSKIGLINNLRSCWSFDGYGGGYIHNAKKDAVYSFMPVRDLQDKEFYFYKD
jgi:hypothetical protein